MASVSRGFTPTRTKEWLRVAAEATVFKWLIMDPLCAPACLRAARLFGGSNTHVTRWRCVSRQVLVSMPCRRWRAVECANPSPLDVCQIANTRPAGCRKAREQHEQEEEEMLWAGSVAPRRPNVEVMHMHYD